MPTWGIKEQILTELIVETDTQGDWITDADDELNNWSGDENDDEEEGRNVETEMEHDERLRKSAMLAKVAAKTKRKMAKGKLTIDDNDNGAETEKTAGVRRTDFEGMVNSQMNRHRLLFHGGPASAASRQFHRPLNEDEQMAFQWRIMCDAAFQEHATASVRIMVPLKHVNFNWKSCNYKKFEQATSLLMVESGIISDGFIGYKEWALHCGEIDDAAFANPSKHQRIRNVMETIKDWRKSYEETWDASLLSIDERCIFALCSTEGFGAHRIWLGEFLKQCFEQGVDFYQQGEYQKRLDIYRSTENIEIDGLALPYYGMSEFLKAPSKYKNTDSMVGFSYERCNAGLIECIISTSERELKKCAGW